MWPFPRHKVVVDMTIHHMDFHAVQINFAADQEAILIGLRPSDVELHIHLPSNVEDVLKDAVAAYLLSRMRG